MWSGGIKTTTGWNYFLSVSNERQGGSRKLFIYLFFFFPILRRLAVYSFLTDPRVVHTHCTRYIIGVYLIGVRLRNVNIHTTRKSSVTLAPPTWNFAKQILPTNVILRVRIRNRKFRTLSASLKTMHAIFRNWRPPG